MTKFQLTSVVFRRLLFRADRAGISTDFNASKVATVRIVHAEEVDEPLLSALGTTYRRFLVRESAVLEAGRGVEVVIFLSEYSSEDGGGSDDD